MAAAAFLFLPDGSKRVPKTIPLKRGSTTVIANKVSDATGMDVEKVKRLQMGFKKYATADKDGNAVINHLHLTGVLSGCSAQFATRIFKAIDADESDSLTFDEVFNYITTLESGTFQQKLDACFSFLAGGCNKSVCTYSSCLDALTEIFTTGDADQHARQLFDDAGAKGKRSIRREAFVMNLANSLSSESSVVMLLAQLIVSEIFSS